MLITEVFVILINHGKINFNQGYENSTNSFHRITQSS